jgi:hypothetical protein
VILLTRHFPRNGEKCYFSFRLCTSHVHIHKELHFYNAADAGTPAQIKSFPRCIACKILISINDVILTAGVFMWTNIPQRDKFAFSALFSFCWELRISDYYFVCFSEFQSLIQNLRFFRCFPKGSQPLGTTFCFRLRIGMEDWTLVILINYLN